KSATLVLVARLMATPQRLTASCNDRCNRSGSRPRAAVTDFLDNVHAFRPTLGRGGDRAAAGYGFFGPARARGGPCRSAGTHHFDGVARASKLSGDGVQRLIRPFN